MAIASVLAVVSLEAQPRAASDVAAIFPPWMGGEDAFARVAAAGALIVRRGILDTILVVHDDGPDLAARLYAAGAWAVIDPTAFGGCLAGAREEAK